MGGLVHRRQVALAVMLAGTRGAHSRGRRPFGGRRRTAWPRGRGACVRGPRVHAFAAAPSPPTLLSLSRLHVCGPVAIGSPPLLLPALAGHGAEVAAGGRRRRRALFHRCDQTQVDGCSAVYCRWRRARRLAVSSPPLLPFAAAPRPLCGRHGMALCGPPRAEDLLFTPVPRACRVHARARARPPPSASFVCYNGWPTGTQAR